MILYLIKNNYNNNIQLVYIFILDTSYMKREREREKEEMKDINKEKYDIAPFPLPLGDAFD